MTRINYKLLQESSDYYEGLGYNRIEAPWTVTNEISSITWPANKQNNPFFLVNKNKTLVASGEQSFLYLYNKGFLPKGKFQTITPCFRDDPFDETHTKYFMKNELIDTENVSADSVHKMANNAFEFFYAYIKNNTTGDFDLRTVVNNHSEDQRQIDIELNGVEIGSYGMRKCSFLEWIYGTGLAEPRFSRLLNEI